MRLLPRGEIIHTRLDTHYINFERMLKKLAILKFSGYVRLLFPEGEGIVLLEGGQVAGSRFQMKDDFTVDVTLLPQITTKTNEQIGYIDLYHLDFDLVQYCRNLVLEIPLSDSSQQPVSGDFQIHLASFLSKRESGVIRWERGNEVAILFIENGDILGIFLDGNAHLVACTPSSLKIATEKEALITVFATKTATVPKDTSQSTIDFQNTVFTRRASAFELVNPNSALHQEFVKKFGELGSDVLFQVNGKKTGIGIAKTLSISYQTIEPILQFLWINGHLAK